MNYYLNLKVINLKNQYQTIEREKKNFISKMKIDIFIDLLKLNQRLDFTQG